MENTVPKIPKIAKCGLQNIGNTCYMNSSLQTIIHNKLLFMFFIKIKKDDDSLLTNIDDNIEFSNDGVPQYSDYLSEAAKQRLGDKIRREQKLSKDDEVEININDYKKFIKNSISGSLSQLINKIIYKGNILDTPDYIKNAFASKFKRFRSSEQQDAQEFLTLVLDEICEETGLESNPQITNPPEQVAKYIKHTKEVKRKYSNTEDVEEKELLLSEFKKFKADNPEMVKQHEYIQYVVGIHRERHNSIIEKMRTFLVNKCKCGLCGQDNYNFDSTNILNIAINGETLEDCFDHFITEKSQTDYRCKYCKQISTILITPKIASPSPILYISLERFIKTHPIIVRKNSKSIKIPEYINIEKYCDFVVAESNCSYRLRAIINHYGQYNGGHYTSYCRDLMDNESWY